MAGNHVHDAHDPIEILELQITCTTLQNEVLMRYVTSPSANLVRIREILSRAFADLKELSVPKDAVRCPDNWVHVMCRCVVPTLKDLSYKPDGKSRATHNRRIPAMPVLTRSTNAGRTHRAPKGN